MPTVNELLVNGEIENTVDVKGTISNILRASGNVSILNQLSGETHLPQVIDRTAIHYDTTEAWNSSTTFIAQRGHIYIYSDFETKTDETGKVIKIPAIKIGDGTSYLIDMPFVTTGNIGEFIDHIRNSEIHVSPSDRTTWNNRITAYADDIHEELILSV